ncbi:pseudouridine synthase [Demequina lignilytica]|uniref:Pseudouridine synthase n=1 Tax=Demequina lignilytica TaxID=3051663 RepID=A0AB35ML78_9MICO|nr:pseudouridine synthase [Demequina sp. SYSU T0a273]MDN4484477.1 pseudouridine synthase [Demequina sp. SYSU T0a273]
MPELEIHRPEGVRLQKVLAAAGVGSRRKCEDLIEAGRVTVDGQIVDQLGVRVDPDEVVIEVDGERISVDANHVTVVLNKPFGVVSTMSDPQGRPALDTFVEKYDQRLFHVGRLDAETTGLLLLTNDGELANRLAHPTHGVEKIYVAKVRGRMTKAQCTLLKSGVDLDDGPVRATDCVILDTAKDSTLVQVSLHEGRNRIVRRMLDKVGHPVLELVRTQFGPIRLGVMAPGELRELTPAEVGKLMHIAGL